MFEHTRSAVPEHRVAAAGLCLWPVSPQRRATAPRALSERQRLSCPPPDPRDLPMTFALIAPWGWRSALTRPAVFPSLCRAALQVCGTLPRRPLRAARQPVRLAAVRPGPRVRAQTSRLHVQLQAGQHGHTVNTRLCHVCHFTNVQELLGLQFQVFFHTAWCHHSVHHGHLESNWP